MRFRTVFRSDRTDLVLLVHFFRGFFESDLLSVRDQLSTIFASVAAVLASFGLILPVLFNHKYRGLNALPTPTLYHQAALADKLMFICLSMGLTAAGTLLNWQSLFPEAKDFLILTPLPLKRVQLFRAKLLALLGLMTLLIVSVNVLPSFSLTAIMSGRWQQPSSNFLQVALQISSLFAACCAAGYFVFFALLTAQGFLLNLLPSAWFPACSLAVQGVLLILTCATLPLVFWIPGLHAWIGTEPRGLLWLPPAWFLGLGECMLGNSDRIMRDLSGNGLCSLCVVVIAAFLTYALTYVRGADQLLKIPATKQNSLAGRCLSRILNTFIRVPQEAAIISFAGKSLLRSRVHKLLAAGIGGACLALVLDGFASLLIDRGLYHRAIQHTALLGAACSAPLIMAYFLLSGLVSIFSLPVELRANWIFRLSEVQGRYLAIAASEKILLAVVVVPVSTLTVLSLAYWMGPGGAVVQGVFVFLMSLLLLQVLLWNWNRIPFTCPCLPAKRNVVQRLLVFSVALGVFAYLATNIEMRLSKSALGITVLLGALLAIVLFMQVQRRRSWAGGLVIRFEEDPDPEVQTLDLRGE